MKITIQCVAMLTVFLLILNCLPLAVGGKEIPTDRSNLGYDLTEEREALLPETGDRFLTRLKLTGAAVILSASILLLLNHRKRI